MGLNGFVIDCGSWEDASGESENIFTNNEI
jgi:hypothetical protein